MIQYDPKLASDCLPEGEYDALLATCVEKVSSKGNSMYEVTWRVACGERETKVLDWFVVPSGLWKLKQLAIVLGAQREFEMATFDPIKFTGKAARLHLTIQPANGAYQESNKVKEYKEARLAPVFAHDPTDDSNIPF